MITNKKRSLVRSALVSGLLLLATAGTAMAGGPNFGAAIYADGQVWGTKGNGALPPPNAHNSQSFDGLYMIINSNNPDGQLPVAEAAPGNPMYNGGRWATHVLQWTQDGFDDHGTVPVLTSYEEIMIHWALGHLEFTDAPSDYFQCPLLPAKDA